MKFNKEYLDLAKFAVDLAKKTGADAAEAYISHSQEVQIKVSNRQAEEVNASEDAGIGLRILKDQKMIFGSSNELSKDSVNNIVTELMKKVPFHTEDEFNTIPGEESGMLKGDWADHKDLLSYDTKIAEVPIQKKIKRTITLEAAGLDYSPKIVGSMFALYQDVSAHVYLANSNGIAGWYPASGCGGGGSFSAAEGKDRQSGTYISVKVKYGDFDPVAVGQKAAENAVKMLGAKPIPSCEVPMVVSPDVGTSLIGYIVGMLSADRVQKGKSLFAEKLGTQVASEIFTLVDDGMFKGGLSTSPVDGEGVPRQTTPLIVGGVLKNYLFDSYTAKKGKVKSTGNRSRSGYQSSGGIGSSNLYIKKGKAAHDEIISGIEKGFYLKDAIGLHAGIDSTSGDFSIPVAGFMIEKGEVTFPVRGVTIGGNLFDFLKSVDKVGDDLQWFESIGCPTFSVSSISIGGVSQK
jgi:PmbA protein